MNVREYQAADLAEWMRMRALLWPEPAQAIDDREREAREWLAREDAVVLVAERSAGEGLAGFAEVGERAYADGCESAPVGYLEGWFVDEDCRGLGAGRELLASAKQWCRGRGYRELASDALLEDTDSQKAHEHVGFEEVERAVRYRMQV